MVLCAAFIVPHGSLILEAKPTDKDGRYELKKAMEKVAAIISSIQPDIILLTSPHGIALSNDFGIYLNKTAEGTAEWEGKYQEYQVNISINQDFSEELFTYLKNASQNVSKIISFSQSESIPIRWGEAVPLWFFREDQHVQFAFISQPQTRYDLQYLSDNSSEIMSLGEHLGNFVTNHKKRIVVFISADLSHTHDEKGSYGFSPDAEKCDQAIMHWALEPSNSQLFERIFPMLKPAKVCGYMGFMLLFGIIMRRNLRCQKIVRKTPTYYGMMVASYLP